MSDLRADYAVSDFDVAHHFKAAAVYDLPRICGGARLLKAVANDWQANAIFVARTGFPFTCRSGVDNSLSAIGNDNCDQVSAESRRPAGADPMKMWFNTAAFAENAIGTYGTSGRNNLRRPGKIDTNLSLFRRFRVTEKLQAEFRAEAFNALNHPNFDNPRDASTGSPSIRSTVFAQTCCTTVAPPSTQTIIQTGESSRVIQFALKLQF
jgi:hypothetical protein